MDKENQHEPTKFEDLKPFVPLQVMVGSNFEDAVRQFKSIVQKSQILRQYKESRSYEKPSDKKRRRVRDAQERNRIEKIREKQIASGEWEKKQKAKEEKRKKKQELRAAQRKQENSDR